MTTETEDCSDAQEAVCVTFNTYANEVPRLSYCSRCGCIVARDYEHLAPSCDIENDDSAGHSWRLVNEIYVELAQSD